MTWALFDNSEELGPIMLAYEGEDAGSVMLQIIRRNPEAVKDDFYEYVKSRPFKVSKLILSGFSNPVSIDELKEAYLSSVNNYAENVGHYPIAHTTLSIMGSENEGGPVKISGVPELSHLPGQPDALQEMRLSHHLQRDRAHPD